MNSIETLWGREPTMVLAVVQAFIAMLIAFGLHLTGDQVATIVAFTALVLGLITRQQVYPMQQVHAAGPEVTAAVRDAKQ